MPMTDTYYVAAPEGDSLPDSSEWSTDIEDAKDHGAEECRDSCSGFPNYVVYEVTVTPKFYSNIEVMWDRA